MSTTDVIYYGLAAAGLMVFLSVTVMFLTWLERKTLARIQMRMGPMRVGIYGTFQLKFSI